MVDDSVVYYVKCADTKNTSYTLASICSAVMRSLVRFACCFCCRNFLTNCCCVCVLFFPTAITNVCTCALCTFCFHVFGHSIFSLFSFFFLIRLLFTFFFLSLAVHKFRNWFWHLDDIYFVFTYIYKYSLYLVYFAFVLLAMRNLCAVSKIRLTIIQSVEHTICMQPTIRDNTKWLYWQIRRMEKYLCVWFVDIARYGTSIWTNARHYFGFVCAHNVLLCVCFFGTLFSSEILFWQPNRMNKHTIQTTLSQ